ncbi:MAG: hypothetical protein H6815_00470 [Phycisphaeraceae bacterium]|nr:hypothetical protein [Phycisphaerales bacterium]MCB9858898.1 hypothetical protein [Phycisphaeraceae bacterium]
MKLVIPQPQDMTEAIEASNERIEKVRKRREQGMREYATRMYGEDNVFRYVNLIAGFVDTLMPQLFSHLPESMVEERFSTIRRAAKKLDIKMGLLSEEAGLEDEVNKALQDAIFAGIGIIKVSQVGSGAYAQVGTQEIETTRPAPCHISLDKYILDPEATSDNEIEWEGMLVSLKDTEIEDYPWGIDPDLEGQIDGIDQLVDTPEEALQRVASETDRNINNQTDRAADIGGKSERTLRPTVQFYEIAFYLGGETYIATMLADASSGDPAQGKYLSFNRYEGPERGPYQRLVLLPINDNVIGVPYISRIFDLHFAVVKLARRLVKGMMNQKRVLTYGPGSAEEAKRVIAAQDSEAIEVPNTQDLIPVDVGGTHEKITENIATLQAWANNSGPDMQLLGGNRSSADTATEAQALANNTNIKISKVRRRVDKFIERVVRACSWIVWHDQYTEELLPLKMKSGAIATVGFSPEEREADFMDIVIRIKPRSTVDLLDPMAKTNRIIEFIKVIPEILPLIMNGIVDLQGLSSLVGAEVGNEDLARAINDTEIRAMHAEVYGSLMQQDPYAMNQVMGGMPGAGPVSAPNGQTVQAHAGQIRSDYGVGAPQQPATRGGV